MTLDKAIKDLETEYKSDYNRQIAEWLKELKKFKEQQSEDAISRKETVQFLENHSNSFEDVKIRMAFRVASSLVNNPYNLPCVQPKPKTGRWISYWNEDTRCYVYVCPECGNKQPFDTKHCWECGARMIEPQERSDKE